ncbi:MAG TPA: glycosyltransferase family 4 protein [Candidatus Baltobacteraceae bacterium]|nr:glycosyltransferase family 4 protein [Candidatus Baltobacteraceae bacterium]
MKRAQAAKLGKAASVNLQGLRLAVLAPITWPTPPPGYGPWEQIAFNIADGMRRRGLDVTLFAPANSRFEGRVESVVPVGCAEDPFIDADVAAARHIGHLMEHADRFDLIHNNFDWKPMTYALGTKRPPMLTTVHGFSTPNILGAYYQCAWRSFYCSISDADRDPGLAYLGTTYNGIDPQEFTFNDRAGDYLVFLGRFHPEKGTHLAIEIAKRSGKQLKIAAIPQDEAYFRTYVEPHIDGEQIQFLGEVKRRERNELLSNALALVHMTTRPERFGLTMVEAMACGTPVLGARMGSIPEIVVDGVTGFLCDSVDDAVEKVPRLAQLGRAACRRRVEAEFTVDRMIDRYLDAYVRAVKLELPPEPTAEQLRWRKHDWWDRPMAFTEIPPKPRSLVFSEP